MLLEDREVEIFNYFSTNATDNHILKMLNEYITLVMMMMMMYL